MARTSEAAVVLTFGTTSATSAQIGQAIDDANLKVTTLLTGLSYSAAMLELFERLLACSQLTNIDPRLKAQKRDDVTDTYVRDDKRDPFLLEAIRLDSTGTLAEAYGEDVSRFSMGVGAGYDTDLTLPVDVS